MPEQAWALPQGSGVPLSPYFHAIAVDFDGTLTAHGAPAPDVLAAVAEVRARGTKVVLVTGRILAELREVFPDADACFDFIVAENGAVLCAAHVPRLLVPPVPFELDEALLRLGIPFRRGKVVLASNGAWDIAVTEEIRRLGLECQIVRNRGDMMILPPGISKGFGVFQALGDLGISHHSAIGIGDAENDHSLLETCELGVAVANAVDALKTHADLVLEEPEGAGVAAFLRGPVLRGEVRIEPKRWQLELGRYDDGSRVRLPASQINMLITGRSKSGKSHLAGSIAEQLIGLGYSVCVIDPEGDYEPIGHLRGVLWINGHGGSLAAGGIERLIEHRFGSVVVDMSGLDDAARRAYKASLLAQLERERAATGLPHWIIIDEAHVPFGREADTSEYFDPSQKGYCFVTYQPGELRAEVWKELDVILALPTGRRPVPAGTPDPIAVIEEMWQQPFARIVDPTRFGQAVLARRDAIEPPRVFTRAPRSSSHVRHWHKYARAKLPADLCFHFHADEPEPPYDAANLEDFHRALTACAPATLRFHAPRGDFSRWIQHVIHDDELSAAVLDLERKISDKTTDVDVDLVRTDLLSAIEDRYLE
jgi:hydroxymethylpyrimidine pyrophosphatase-like HAD family hydrolase